MQLKNHTSAELTRVSAHVLTKARRLVYYRFHWYSSIDGTSPSGCLTCNHFTLQELLFTLLNKTCFMFSSAKRLSFPFLLIILFASCKVHWVPDYSAAIEDQIIVNAQKNDRLYLDMLDAQSPTIYTNYIERYNDLEAEINSIQMKNEARQKNDNMLKIIKNLQTAFQQYRREHREKKTLSRGEILVYQQNIRAFWTPLLVAEHGLKLAK
jgi:hypothetical protein